MWQWLYQVSAAHILDVAAVADGDPGRRAAGGVGLVLRHRVCALVRVHVTVEHQVDAIHAGTAARSCAREQESQDSGA